VKKRSRLSESKKRFLRENCNDFGRSVAFALYKRELIADWIDTLERVVNDIEELSKMDYRRKTAEQSDASPSLDKTEETKRLKDLINTLRASADSLYTECCAASNSYRWGLALRPPIEKREVANWDLIATINIELRLRAPDTYPRKVLELHALYSKSNQATHRYDEVIWPLIVKAHG
jgi:hypothetical protein